jgi:hypothetical protein
VWCGVDLAGSGQGPVAAIVKVVMNLRVPAPQN